MLMLDAEVEAMAATAEWVQRNGLTGYLTTDSGDDFLRLYLEEGEDALRARLKNAAYYISHKLSTLTICQERVLERFG